MKMILVKEKRRARPAISLLLLTCLLLLPSAGPAVEISISPTTRSTARDLSGRVASILQQYRPDARDEFDQERLTRIFYQAFERNILHPPILYSALTVRKRKNGFVDLINNMIKAAEVLKDDAYIDRLLNRFLNRTFRISKYKNKVLLAEADLKKRENLFRGMDRPLRDAIFEVATSKTDNKKIAYRFFNNFYLPLIKINKLFDRIYIYDNERPYEYFLDRFSKQDLVRSSNEFFSFTRNLDFVNAETSLTKLIKHYYRKLGLNPWERSDIIVSKNINLSVHKAILEAFKSSYKDSYEFEKIIKNFLNYVDNEDYLIKSIDYKRQEKDVYDNRLFFEFIYYQLLVPYELIRFPVLDNDGNPISIDKLMGEMGVSSSEASFNRTVDGSIREQFCKKILGTDITKIIVPKGKISTLLLLEKIRGQIQGHLDKRISVAILLPNTERNNEGSNFEIERYNYLKRELFRDLKDSLELAFTSSEIANYLTTLLELNKSYRTGDVTSFYVVTHDIYKNYFNRMTPEDRQKVFTERLKLGLSSSSFVGKKAAQFILTEMETIEEEFSQIYSISRATEIHDLSDVVELRYRTKPNAKRQPTVEPENKPEILYFLLGNLRKLLTILSDDEIKLSRNDYRRAYKIVNNILDIYNHFRPLSTKTGPKQTGILSAIIEKKDVRQPLIKFSRKFTRKKKGDEVTKGYRREVVAKIIGHNFQNMETVFWALENNNAQIFPEEVSFSYTVPNFDLLIPITEQVHIENKNFIRDTLGNFPLNLSLFEGLDDNFVEQFFFMNPSVRGKTRISCFDDAVREAIKIRLGETTSPEAKSSLKAFEDAQRDRLGEGCRQFSSVFGIQDLWEKTAEAIAQEKAGGKKPFYQDYQAFYRGGYFGKDEAGAAEFKENISAAFINKFYNTSEDKLDLYYNLLAGEEGRNLGLTGVIDKYKPGEIEFVDIYQQAVLQLMEDLFHGKGLAEGKEFIGQLVYEREKNKAKKIDDDIIYSDSFFQFCDWMSVCISNFKDYPQIRRLFIDDATLKRLDTTVAGL